MDRNVGYGEASYHIINSLSKQGVECLIKSPDAPIGISFCQPQDYTFSPNQYRIGYTPWESTELMPKWSKSIEDNLDELWTTSQWCKDIFSKHTDKPIFIYEHGIEDTWLPEKRTRDKYRPFRFLHIGEPAYRKDAQMVVDAFISLYGNNPAYELVIKCSSINTTRVLNAKTGEVRGSPDGAYSNIKIIESYLSVEQMNGLYDLCDVFVYPSWGEGFGFNPLQAMAKGIPTICTESWASYARYITCPLKSELVPSPWPTLHPGNMYKADFDQLMFYMKDLTQNYDKYSDLAYKNSFLIHKDYNWTKVTNPAVQRLKEIHKNL